MTNLVETIVKLWVCETDGSQDTKKLVIPVSDVLAYNKKCFFNSENSHMKNRACMNHYAETQLYFLFRCKRFLKFK